MNLRKLKIQKIRGIDSKEFTFDIHPNTPTFFVAPNGFGKTSIAKSIVDARNEYPFTSKKDVVRRSRINNTLAEKFNRLGVFKNLPEDDQIGLFR